MLQRAFLFILLIPFSSTAQTIDLDQIITLRYEQERLEDILSDISLTYDLSIAYSRDFIPINQRITINSINIPLQLGLRELFAPTQVVFAVIGNSIVLRVDNGKEIISKSPIPKEIEIPSEKIEKKEVIRITRNYRKIPPLINTGFPVLIKYHTIDPSVLDSLKNLVIIYGTGIPSIYEDSPFREMAQVTLVPPIGTNEKLADSITNTFSFNILYGLNGGVEGIEVGGFGNHLRNNMKGLQIAGIWNKVEGTVSGTQFASVANINEGYTKGLQFTLGVNITNEAKAIQMAGIMNIAKGDFAGLQMAIIGNYIRTKGEGIQVAGLFNKANSYVHKQFAIGYNKAGDIQNVQVGLINVANYVKGTQYGLVNIADEVQGTPIGFFSFIKKGYNRIEVAGGESLFANVGFKFGKRKFYNIIHFGYRFTNDVWSLGYGLGTGIPIGNKQHLHIEWILSHINESDWWTTNRNWLHQLKFTYDWEFGGKKESLFLGPTFNWSMSKIIDQENNQLVGSNLPSYTLVNTTRASSNWKIWFGLTAGLRF